MRQKWSRGRGEEEGRQMILVWRQMCRGGVEGKDGAVAEAIGFDQDTAPTGKPLSLLGRHNKRVCVGKVVTVPRSNIDTVTPHPFSAAVSTPLSMSPTSPNICCLQKMPPQTATHHAPPACAATPPSAPSSFCGPPASVVFGCVCHLYH